MSALPPKRRSGGGNKGLVLAVPCSLSGAGARRVGQGALRASVGITSTLAAYLKRPDKARPACDQSSTARKNS